MSEPAYDAVTRKCPSCGGSNFIVGNLLGYGIGFKPRNSGLFSFGETVHGIKCADCGNLQLFSGKFPHSPRP
jgi:predicted nucleic-acid-binding Zn-ribbon protein